MTIRPVHGAALLLALAGPAVAIPHDSRPELRQVSTPAIGKPVTVSVGDDMLDQGTVAIAKGILLAEPDDIATRRFSAGFYPQTGEDADFTYHSFARGAVAGDGLGKAQGAGDVVSLRADKRKQQLCPLVRIRIAAFGLKACDSEHGYTRIERPIAGAGFRQTLIYSGRVGDAIRLSYRETGGGTPDFTNQAEYDLSRSDIVTYKGARLRIVKADGQGISYVVLSGFDPRR
jgi:hypothetical protein